MAKLIPPFISERASRGERELFHALRDDPETSGWTIFHSLDIRRHLTKLEGEIDLICIVPGHGILCIEVKACDVSRENGIWKYPYATSFEGPFKQVSRAMHSLRNWIGESDQQLRNLLYFSAVAFTEIEFGARSPEWHPWQIISRQDLAASRPSRLIVRILDRAHAHVREHKPTWYHPERSRPTVAVAKRLGDILRPDFEYAHSARAEVSRVERAISNATTEQLEAIDQLYGNDRIVVTGLAGTGKTWLALSAARRAIDEGRSVLLLCFNKLLGEWLTAQTEDLKLASERSGVHFFVGTFHSFLLQYDDQIPSAPGQEFWQTTLPERVIGHLLGAPEGKNPLFDFLILDESQDILRTAYLDVLDLVLSKGIASGNWAMFGDFAHQSIFSTHALHAGTDTPSLLHSRAPSFATFRLGTNCRNARSVAEITAIATRLTPGYRRLLHEGETGSVDPKFYEDSSEQTHFLGLEVERLLRSHPPGNIVVLSPRRDDASCAAHLLNRNREIILAPLVSPVARDGQVGYCTIHRFKGLEAPAVIVTDIENLDDDQAVQLLYVAMSRARVHLILLMHKRLQPRYQQLLLSQLRGLSR